MSPKHLNLGCGRNSREGWVNLDLVPLPGVDVVWDVNRLLGETHGTENGFCKGGFD